MFSNDSLHQSFPKTTLFLLMVIGWPTYGAGQNITIRRQIKIWAKNRRKTNSTEKYIAGADFSADLANWAK